MTPRREVRFVGFFSSFSVDERERNVGLLEGILRLEKALGIFRRIDCGQVQGTSALRSFQESRLQTALRSLRSPLSNFEKKMSTLHYWEPSAVLDRLILYSEDGMVLRMWVRGVDY